MNKENIRNIAIIAHVDHGKTTLVDAFLKQSNIFRDNQDEMSQEMILDTGELEREKGITIKAKNISVNYNEHFINIIDTPGHADFGGEVERTLNMADGCLLIVDAAEGPMPQTRFVLKKALELNLKPIVVINKIDKPSTDIKRTTSKIQDLFLDLATTEDQLEFPIFYAIGRDGKVWAEMPENKEEEADIRPLLDKIIDYVPSPKGDEEAPFQMQITTLDFDDYTGTFLIGKVTKGSIKPGKNVVVAMPNEEAGYDIDSKGSVKKVLIKSGLVFKEVDSASVGEVIAIVGIDSKAIGGTICDPQNIEVLPNIKISDPSVRIKIEANTSPFMGKEGEFVSC
ncbi:MAG: GTP-binding protein [Candidatus Dojkabacteria bacterium]|nr:GTP-binding protein [Candidatus Dojkabacteria bacterium]